VLAVICRSLEYFVTAFLDDAQMPRFPDE